MVTKAEVGGKPTRAGPALGWSVRWRGDDRYMLSQSAEDAVRAAFHYGWGVTTRAGRRALREAGEVDVAPARTWRVQTPGGHVWLMHGRDSRHARQLVVAAMPAQDFEGLQATECDPYWFFKAISAEWLAVIGKGLWTLKPRDRGVGKLAKIGPHSRNTLEISLRLAMELDWWAGHEGFGRVLHSPSRDLAKKVHWGSVPWGVVERCLEAGLRMPWSPLTPVQRGALREMAGAYGDLGDIESLTDEVLIGLWLEGPEYEPPAHVHGPGY